MNQSFSTIGQVASHDFGSTANPNPRLANYVSGYVDNTENQPSRLAGFVYWLLVRRNDERLVAWNQDMEHAAKFARNRTQMICYQSDV